MVAAIGFDEARGDIVTVESMAFEPGEVAGALVEANSLTRFLERNAMTLVQIGVLSLIAMILALTVIRPILVRPHPAAAAAPALAGTKDAGDPVLPDIAVQPGLPAPEGGERAQVADNANLRRTVAERPEQTVAMLREWLEPGDLSAPKREVA